MPIISMSGRDTMEDGAWEVQCNHHIRQLGAHQDHISGFHCDLSTCSNGDPQVCLMRDLCRMCKWWRHRVNLYFCWVISKHECGFVYLDWLSTMFDIFLGGLKGVKKRSKHATQKQSKTNQWWRFIISLHWLVWTSLDLIESSPVLLHGLTQRDSTILCLYWKCTRLQPPLNLAWASAGASLTPSPTMATNRWTSVGTSPSNRGSRPRKQQIFRSRLQRPRRETLGAGILCNSLTFADLPEGNTWGSRLLPFRFPVRNDL